MNLVVESYECCACWLTFKIKEYLKIHKINEHEPCGGAIWMLCMLIYFQKWRIFEEAKDESMNLVEPYESCACWFSYLNWNEMCCSVGGPRWTPWRAQISKSHLSVVNFDLLSKMKYIWKTPINICVCWFSFIIEIYLLIMNPQETC